MSRRSRMTAEFEALFREQAEIHKKKKSLKALARITGYSPCYCWVQIQAQLKLISKNVSVSRETNPDTLP